MLDGLIYGGEGRISSRQYQGRISLSTFFLFYYGHFFFYSAHNAVVPITISFFIFQQFYLTFSYKKKIFAT